MRPLLARDVREAIAHQRRVRIDCVRHDGRAHNRSGQQDGIRSGELWNETAGHVAPVRSANEEGSKKTDGDNGEQRDDCPLKRTQTDAVVQTQDCKRHTGSDEPAKEKRQSEQQIECNCSTDDFGNVRCHRGEFGLRPKGESNPS